MNIAILGATSQIAKDLIISFSENCSNYNILMFSRSPVRVKEQFESLGKLIEYPNLSYEDFSNHDNYDVVINFVGVGDPARAKSIGSSILEITEKYDKLALDYLKNNPTCKYIFLSSGAVYGGNFDEPVDASSKSVVDINNLGSRDWYSIAKIYAEAKHRALNDLDITDVRVFNYYSHTQDDNSASLISDIVRSMRSGEIFITADYDIARDYISTKDFFNLMVCMFKADFYNGAIDCYSMFPVKKFEMLEYFKEKFNLRYEKVKNAGVNATGIKKNYYSKNQVASKFLYTPIYSSIDGLTKEVEVALSK